MTKTRTSVSTESLAELTDHRARPCLSLYLPTHRRHLESQQDPIRFRNLVKNLEALLEQQYPDIQARELTKPLLSLSEDHIFWEQTLDGIAVFVSPDFFRVFRLKRSVPESTHVGDIFHLTPLRRYLQTNGRYQVLGLSKDKIRLFEGNNEVLDEIMLVPGVPRTIVEALGEEAGEAHQTAANYGTVGRGDVAMHHGIGSKKEEVKADELKFFRSVDHAILEHYSRPSSLPLILASLPEHQHLFHHASRNPFLVAQGIHVNPEVILRDELQKLAWEIIEHQSVEHERNLVEEFMLSQSQGLGSSNKEQVHQAASIGRVATLLIDSDDRIPGIESLDSLAELVEKDGGQICVLSSEHMPGKTGLAAIYRY